MLYYKRGSESDVLKEEDLRQGLSEALGKLGERKKVLAIPPDYTRLHSQAGIVTRLAWEYYRSRLTDVLPALGTHAPMTETEIKSMFGNVPLSLFRIHDWRKDVLTLGEVPAEFIRQQSEGKVDYPWKAQVNRLLVEGSFDLILSIGQIVPHEVVGMAGYNKNIFVGTGGPEGINKSHFLGAVYGMERMMGRADTPVRRVLNYASEHFARKLPIVYVCENNMYAVTTPASYAIPVEHVAERAAAYGIPGVTVDGMDVTAVHDAAKLAVQRARQGAGPSLVECQTYRYLGHFVSEEFLLGGKSYRSDEEINQWKARDPISNLGNKLIEKGVLSKEKAAGIEADIKAKIEEAVTFARQSPLPAPEEALEDLFA